MDDLWFRLLLGHLAGDYLLQWQTMALAKACPGWKGLLYSLLHVAIYTTCICLFLWTAKPLFIVLIFLSHWPIDRWSLGCWWAKKLGSMGALWKDMMNDTVASRQDTVAAAFSSIVYVVIDNTLHLILMWVIVHWVGG